MSHPNLQATNLFSVKGLVAVITGGGTGLGRTMALTLHANGASKIFIVGRRPEPLQETASLATPSSELGTIIPIPGDISTQSSLEEIYTKISAQTTHVDLLIANSGTMGPRAQPPSVSPSGDGQQQPSISEIRDELWSVPMEEFSRVFDINVTGTYYTIIAFLPLLDAANKKRPEPIPDVLSAPTSQVIVTSSIAGFNRLVPFSFAYSLSKNATTHLVKMMSTALNGYDIRVNGIAPGLYHSDLAMPLFESRGVVGRGVSRGSFPREMIPATRAGGEEDMGGLVLWLAGLSGGFVNGSVIVTDGGRLGGVPSSY